MTRDPLWLVLAGYALAALAVGLFGFVAIRGLALCFLDALRTVLP